MCWRLWPHFLSQGSCSQIHCTIQFSDDRTQSFLFDIVLMPAYIYIFFFHFKELLWADHSVSEHSVPLQHELPGGDHWLAVCYEPTHQPEHSLNVTSGTQVQHSLSCICGNNFSIWVRKFCALVHQTWWCLFLFRLMVCNQDTGEAGWKRNVWTVDMFDVFIMP